MAYRKDAQYYFYANYKPNVFKVVTDEWRSERLIMPEIIVNPDIFPNEDAEGKENASADDVWNDLSIAEMIDGTNFANLKL